MSANMPRNPTLHAADSSCLPKLGGLESDITSTIHLYKLREDYFDTLGEITLEADFELDGGYDD